MKKPYVTCTNYWQRILYMKGPTMRQRLERKISFLCLFVCLFFPSAFLVLFFLLFFWRLSAFFHPHFPIRNRRYTVRVFQTPQLYPMLRIYTMCLKKQTSQPPRRLVAYLLIRCIICCPKRLRTQTNKQTNYQTNLLPCVNTEASFRRYFKYTY